VAGRRFSFDAQLTRYRVLAFCTLLMFGVIAGRLAYLQVFRGADYRQQAEENRIRPEILRAHRGRLLDRHGRVIADNAPSYHLSFDVRDRAFRKNPGARGAVVTELARVLGRDEEELRAEVERARRAALPPITVARNLDFATLSAILERMDQLPGVEVRPQPARRYTHGTLASHLIGYLGEVSESELAAKAETEPGYRPGDLIGRSGIEKTYEAYLRGSDGVEYVEVDALGRRTNLFEELPSLPSVPGDDIVLGLDLDLQLAAEAALDSMPSVLSKEFGDAAEAHPGCIVAMDPSTGEVLAMACRPCFDPNLFVAGLNREDWRILSGEGHPLLNRVTQSASPPGSTFKILTALAALHDGEVTPFATMPASCNGGYFYGNRLFHCHLKGGHGSLALRDAMARSCDVYFYQLGLRLGVERMMQYAVACSLDCVTRIDLPQERSPLIPTIDWYRTARGGPPGGGAALNLSIGQGELLLTPIALARFVSAVVNGGTILRPRVVRQIVRPDGTIVLDMADRKAVEGRLPATEAELAVVRDALEAVVMGDNGTGKRARVEPFRVGGKTGTAQNPHGQDHAWFVGYAPAEDPEIVVVAFLEAGGHGGVAAAPLAQKVMEVYLKPTAQTLATGGMQ
jgi:penicillin-binding protein 2